MSPVFTLEEARALMPRVRALTGPAFELANSFSAELERIERDKSRRPEEVEALRERLQSLVTAWADGIRALGLEVKGLWLVDFNAGDGYWCWAHPEEHLDHWHGHDEGFAARVLLAERPVLAVRE